MTVNAQKIIDSAVDRCLRAGVRMTKKRRLILSCLLKQKKPGRAPALFVQLAASSF